MVFCKESVLRRMGSTKIYKSPPKKDTRQSTLNRRRDMTCFKTGRFNIATPFKTESQLGHSQKQQPFVEFSPHQDRASLMTSVGSGIGATSSLGRRRRRRPLSATAGARSGRRKRQTRVTKVRVVNGRVALRVGGFPGVQRVGASQLVRFVPLNKLKAAAKRVLGQSSFRRRTKGRRGRKRRIGQRRQ